MAETYVVTGGAGFIGSHIAERLLAEGHRVRIVDNFSTGKRENLTALGGSLQVHAISITDLDALRQVFSGAQYVFHQAALPSVPRSIDDPLTTHQVNVTGTLNVLIAARDAGVRRVVYAASSSAYGDVEQEYKTETLSPKPLSPYGVSKLAAEYYCQVFTHVYGLETAALRYFNVFGPRQDETSQYAAVIPKFIHAMMSGQPPMIYGDGTQSRDFTYIANVVHGNLLAMHAPSAPGQVMNLALGGSVSLLDLVARLNRLLGTNYAPMHTPARKGDILHSRADIEKAIDLLDFAPVVDFDTGLARTVEWFGQRMMKS
ncbi:MAG: SDR family oxidoreductase [Anaerolineae bacterium]|nr:SDR family oxidoreductase [Anaerolineae bacterium]NUQ05124.1 SDR family oxidoreductase [Anaerolineae bacterium]